MIKNRHYKNSLNEELSKVKSMMKYLNEDYVFDDEDAPIEGDYDEEMPEEEPQEDIRHYHGNENKPQEKEENNDMNLSKGDQRIAKIREVALDGLQEYAEDVDSEAYQFYKKIWLLADKAVSEKESASNGGGN
jgi:hypothetical protein